MNGSSDDYVMLSALQHYLFCPRQCALIHVENQWGENFLTASGRQLHERTDSAVRETRKRVHRATALRLVSEKHGLMGIADVVEFIRQDAACDDDGVVRAVRLDGLSGWWRPFPVEYKRGKPKTYRADEVQLCAQALCLEEMLKVSIASGALFYGTPRRRSAVDFDPDLRALTVETARAVRQMIVRGETPPPDGDRGCDACSLVEVCRPDSVGSGRSAAEWLGRAVEGSLGE